MASSIAAMHDLPVDHLPRATASAICKSSRRLALTAIVLSPLLSLNDPRPPSGVGGFVGHVVDIGGHRRRQGRHGPRSVSSMSASVRTSLASPMTASGITKRSVHAGRRVLGRSPVASPSTPVSVPRKRRRPLDRCRRLDAREMAGPAHEIRLAHQRPVDAGRARPRGDRPRRSDPRHRERATGCG